jgi:hypothetical protein
LEGCGSKTAKWQLLSPDKPEVFAAWQQKMRAVAKKQALLHCETPVGYAV